MKIRSGFVSNSSSSSFIIGIVNMKDKTIDKEILEKTKVEHHVYGEERPWILDEKSNITNDTTLYIDAFYCGEVSIKDVEQGDNIYYFFDTDHSDMDFWDEECGYYDYDISFDQFKQSSQDKYELISSLGGDVEYGAGRDG